MSDANKSPTSFHAVSATVKVGVVVVVLGFAALAANHAETLPQDSRAVGVVGTATDSEANRPPEAVYLPTRRR